LFWTGKNGIGGGFSTSSEYVRELIRRDQGRLHLRGLLLEGASSASTAPADQAYFNSLRKESAAASRHDNQAGHPARGGSPGR
jgi:antitoxin ParD1/3/4